MSTSTLERKGTERNGTERKGSERTTRHAPTPRAVESGHPSTRVAPGINGPRRRPTHPASVGAAVGPRGRRPVTSGDVPRRVASTWCAQPVSAGRIRARRTGAVAVLVGVAMALGVWIFAVLGQSYADSVTPQPVATEVVHVRQGESLSAIAARVAPDMPSQTVIDKILELNDLQSSGLRVGQPLLTPEYR